jgi:RND family efflux transporter MFP subunit
VGGYLQYVNYTEGDAVKKDQVLFEIDPREYQAGLDHATAQVKSRQAQLTQAEAVYKRTNQLVPSGGATREDLEKDLRTRDVAVAAVEAALADVEVQKLNLEFTKVRSPVNGRADRAKVKVGDLISANLVDPTVLTTIVSLDPIYANFNADELTLLRVRQAVREGKLPARQDKAPEVELGLGEGGTTYPYHGSMDFVGNQVVNGSIAVRGIFPNKDLALSPGLFARIRMPLGPPHEMLLVNDRALGTNRGQKFLYIVNEKNEVVYRPVTIGDLHKGLREVVAGLNPGERVIINGLLRVRPGITVDPKPGKMEPEPIRSDGPADAP